MNSYDSQTRAQWRSYYSYVLVTIGAIVGLGNIFYFPFLVMKFGGLFVLFYVISEILISIPLLFSELLIGRRGKQNPVGSISIMAMEANASRYWRNIGWLCFIILFLTLSYYTVAVAFPLGYFFHTTNTLFSQGNLLTMSNMTDHFFALEICFLIFLAITMMVIIRGINRGLEAISCITVPTYLILLLGLAIYASYQGNFLASINQLFYIPADQNILPVLFAALTFAFFKLNIGMGSMMVYGSYLPYNVPLAQSTAIIVCFDAIASLLSYFIIAPLMLQSSAVSQSEAWSYHNAMAIFATTPNGAFIAALFFLAGVIAAWTATIAMAESVVLTLIERWNMTRLQSVMVISGGAILVGSIIVLSYTMWPNVTLFSTWSIAEFIRNFASDIATPISAFLIAIFCGWIVKKRVTAQELVFPPTVYTIWRCLVRYLAPICILVILFLIGFN